MSTLKIDLSDALDAALTERVKASGVLSKEEYLLSLVESDCAIGELDGILEERIDGPFVSFDPSSDWQEHVRKTAAERNKA